MIKSERLKVKARRVVMREPHGQQLAKQSKLIAETDSVFEAGVGILGFKLISFKTGIIHSDTDRC